jgi:hypothetical protein
MSAPSTHTAATRADHQRVERSAVTLARHLADDDFRGIDPYDAMIGGVSRALGSRSKWARIALTQFHRRSPVNLRPLFGIKPGRNPKTLALFLLGEDALPADLRDAALIARAHALLLESSTVGQGGAWRGWGYNFDWQSRAFHAPAGTPTVVNSAFAVQALIGAEARLGIPVPAGVLEQCAAFFAHALNRKRFDDGEYCLSYTPHDESSVINANILGAAAMCLLSRRLGDPALAEDAWGAVQYTLTRQGADGSWPYGAYEYQGWIDNFHTGFNLDALRAIVAAGVYGPERQRRLADSIARGLAYFTRAFFGEDGRPYYYAGHKGIVDGHSVGTAIGVLADDASTIELAYRVAGWAFEHMELRDGQFAFRWYGLGLRNPVKYKRWVQGWMFWGMSRLSAAGRQGASSAASASGRDR